MAEMTGSMHELKYRRLVSSDIYSNNYRPYSAENNSELKTSLLNILLDRIINFLQAAKHENKIDASQRSFRLGSEAQFSKKKQEQEEVNFTADAAEQEQVAPVQIEEVSGFSFNKFILDKTHYPLSARELKFTAAKIYQKVASANIVAEAKVNSEKYISKFRNSENKFAKKINFVIDAVYNSNAFQRVISESDRLYAYISETRQRKITASGILALAVLALVFIGEEKGGNVFDNQFKQDYHTTEQNFNAVPATKPRFKMVDMEWLKFPEEAITKFEISYIPKNRIGNVKVRSANPADLAALQALAGPYYDQVLTEQKIAEARGASIAMADASRSPEFTFGSVASNYSGQIPAGDIETMARSIVAKVWNGAAVTPADFTTTEEVETAGLSAEEIARITNAAEPVNANYEKNIPELSELSPAAGSGGQTPGGLYKDHDPNDVPQIDLSALSPEAGGKPKSLEEIIGEGVPSELPKDAKELMDIIPADGMPRKKRTLKVRHEFEIDKITHTNPFPEGVSSRDLQEQMRKNPDGEFDVLPPEKELDIVVKKKEDTEFEKNTGAHSSMGKKNYEAAINEYKDVLETDPNNKDALFGIATAYHKKGDIKNARQAYIKLLMLDQNNWKVMNNFLVLLSQDTPKVALKELARLEENNPEFSPIPAQMGLINVKMGDYKTAITHLSRAVMLEPENLKYRYNLAKVLVYTDQNKLAIPLYNQILQAGKDGRDLPESERQIEKELAELISQDAYKQQFNYE